MTNSARKANLANRSGLIKMIWMGKTTKKTKMARKSHATKMAKSTPECKNGKHRKSKEVLKYWNSNIVKIA